MNPSLLKKIMLPAFMLVLLGQPLKAQWVVYDPAQFANMIKSIANEVELISKAGKTLQETKKILNAAVRTKEEIENIYSLQWEVQEALKIARGIQDLKWSDLDGVTRSAMGISVDPMVYLPELPETDWLRPALRAKPNPHNARLLYGLLTGLHAASDPVPDLVSYDALNQQTLLNQFAFTEMSAQKKMQAALSYHELAEEMIYGARELMEAVKRDRRLTMNEAERLNALKQCREVIQQSIELKLEADELLRTATEQPSASKKALLEAYRNHLVRKALAEEPQMKYGQ
ncbi:DUF4141 domain-containing protein [Cesiribacter sp. SM1]|uniref:DUF4141 domain-containing protein n=1 Tax=Cesiribacter sp. SM1 TaxID=2861196 RepID=UPI001CD19930|nr:DUF4141 domain-containing protein [Cesiribacter sp. SM1]